MATSRPRAEVEREIKETLGLVPNFFSRFPDATLDFEWELFRRFEMQEPNQAPPSRGGVVLPAKIRQLIGVAVHSETKCEYCAYFHTELARLLGATEEEIQEAVHYAKHTLGLSAYVNGIQEDLAGFKREVDEIVDYLGGESKARKAA